MRSNRFTQSVSPVAQRGIVLVITLIALALLLLTTIALFRSASSTLLSAGNLGFQRDLNNQAEIAIQAAIAQLNSGNLNTTTIRNTTDATKHYSAVRLPSTSYGVPTELLNAGSTYTASGTSTSGVNGVSMNYIIDRMCDSSMNTKDADSNSCVVISDIYGTGGAILPANHAQVTTSNATVYRISVRVDGPRNTQLFVQTTVAL